MSSAVEGVAAVETSEATGGHRVAELILRFRELGILVALLAVIGGTAINHREFVDQTSLQQLFGDAALIAILAIGQTLVIVTRNVDLSVGSILGLSAYATGVIFVDHPGVSPIVVMLAGTGIGLVCGVVNGLLVTLLRVPSLVVTLGTLYAIRGLVSTWGAGTRIDAADLPEWFNKIGFGTFLKVPYLCLILIALLTIALYGTHRFRAGRDFYAIGSNPDAARLAGIPVGRRVFATFALSGAIAGLAGVLWLSYYGSVDSTAGGGYEFTVISAVVVGGVAIFGGSGSVLGAVLGAILLNTIATSLIVVGVSSNWEIALQGGLLVAAIAFDRLVSVRVAPALRTRRSSRVA